MGRKVKMPQKSLWDQRKWKRCKKLFFEEENNKKWREEDISARECKGAVSYISKGR